MHFLQYSKSVTSRRFESETSLFFYSKFWHSNFVSSILLSLRRVLFSRSWISCRYEAFLAISCCRALLNCLQSSLYLALKLSTCCKFSLMFRIFCVTCVISSSEIRIYCILVFRPSCRRMFSSCNWFISCLILEIWSPAASFSMSISLFL